MTRVGVGAIVVVWCAWVDALSGSSQCRGECPLLVFRMFKELNMARKPKSTATVPPPSPNPTGKYWLSQDAAWGGFINIRLDVSDKDAFATWREMRGGDFWNVFDDLIGQGMKVAFAYDPENECYVVTFTGRLVETDNSRYCMTTRSGTWEDCLALAVWKHEMTGSGFYDSFKPRTGRMDSWG